MKLSDKAIEAALEEGKLWCEGMQLNSPNPAVWKVLRVTNKNGNYKTIKKFNTREERDEALERLRAEAMIKAAYAAQFKSSESKALKKAWICYSLCEGGGAYDGPFFVKYEPEEGEYDKIEPILYYDAAYAAQFQSEEYADVIKSLRVMHDSIITDAKEQFRDGIHETMPSKAADAIEALLAERDALKSELIDYKDAAASEADFVNEQAEKIRELKAERDALAARLAPVEDEALVERDALKKAVEAEQSMTKLRLGPFLKKVRQEKQMTLRAVEEATDKEISNAYLSQLESGKVTKPSPHVLYTLSLVFGVAYETLMELAGYIMPAPNRLAPVEDEELVEIAARAICLVKCALVEWRCKDDGVCKAPVGDFRDPNYVRTVSLGSAWRQARAAIAATRPHIEAAERERCAKIAEGSFLFDIETWLNSTKKEMTAHVAKAIAAAIRSGSGSVK